MAPPPPVQTANPGMLGPPAGRPPMVPALPQLQQASVQVALSRVHSHTRQSVCAAARCPPCGSQAVVCRPSERSSRVFTLPSSQVALRDSDIGLVVSQVEELLAKGFERTIPALQREAQLSDGWIPIASLLNYSSLGPLVKTHTLKPTRLSIDMLACHRACRALSHALLPSPWPCPA